MAIQQPKKQKMVSYDQSGYVGTSRSRRAKEAYEGGEMPASKWTKQALIEAIADAFGDEVAEKAQKVSKAELSSSFLEISSWHHVGAYATPVWFYQIVEDRTADEGSQLVDQLIQEKAEQKAEQKAEKKPAKKEEKKSVFLKIVAERNTSKYRRWVNWKSFTYFCIAKEGEKFAKIIAADSNMMEDKIRLDGKHVLNIVRIDSRRHFTKEIKKCFKMAKIGNVSRNIDRCLKKEAKNEEKDKQ